MESNENIKNENNNQNNDKKENKGKANYKAMNPRAAKIANVLFQERRR